MSQAPLVGKPVVVLGIHRSGTSSVTNALSHVGIHFGRDADFYPSDENNEAGFFELKDLIGLNRKALSTFYLAYDRVGPLPGDWREHPRTVGLLQSIRKTLEKHYAGQERWGWKEPSTSLLLPLYQEVLNSAGLDANYVICVRNPLEVAASELAWKDDSQKKHSAPYGNLVFGIWLQFTLSALRETRGASRTVVVYDDFLSDTRRLVQAIIQGLGDWTVSQDRIDSAVASVRKDLKHQQRNSEELSGLTGLVARTYELCREASADPDRFRGGFLDARIEQLWDELVLVRQTFAEPSSPYGTIKMSWPGGTAEQRYLPTGQWQAFRIPIAAPASTELQGVLYPLPSVLWLRNGRWVSGDRSWPCTITAASFTEETDEGSAKRMTVYPGVPQVTLRTPDDPGPFELSFDLRVDFNPLATLEAAARASATMQRLSARVAQMESYAASLEARLNPGAAGPSGR